MDGRQGVHFVIVGVLLPSLFCWLYAFLGGVVVLSGLVDGVRVRHAEDGRPAFFLEQVREVFML